MSRFERTGYDYIPSPGEEYYPQGKKVDSVGGTVIASGTDSDLVRLSDGTTVLTDKSGQRRSK
jgi:hypothetical protein